MRDFALADSSAPLWREPLLNLLNLLNPLNSCRCSGCQPLALANTMIVPPVTPLRPPKVPHFSAHTPGAHLGELPLHRSHNAKPSALPRSEERRVGKECTSRAWKWQ